MGGHSRGSWLGGDDPVDGIGPATSYGGRAGAYGHLPPPVNRSPRFPAAPGSERGRPPIVAPGAVDIPDVPSGTVLNLRAGEWSNMTGRPPEAYVTMTVTEVRPDWARTRDDMVWVTGHKPECSYESVEPHLPCVTLMVQVAVLRAAVGL